MGVYILNKRNKPLISIIVPIYNVEKYLEKCIKSLINQTYDNLEIILVNDGSKDKSIDICNKYIIMDDRIKLINKKNGGLSDARNAGIIMANGEYLGFVDSDDYIKDTMYEYLYNLMVDYKADISICNYLYFYEGKETIENPKYKSEEVIKSFDSKNALIELLKGDLIQDFAWNKLYKAELFNNIKYPLGKNMEDIGTTYKLFDASKRIVLGNSIQYFYLQRSNSIMGDRDLNLYKNLYELSLERYEYIDNIYPNLQEGCIDMLNKIIAIYKVKNNEVHNYFFEVKLDKKYKELFKKLNLSELNRKLLIKFLLFRINRYMFKFM